MAIHCNRRRWIAAALLAAAAAANAQNPSTPITATPPPPTPQTAPQATPQTAPPSGAPSPATTDPATTAQPATPAAPQGGTIHGTVFAGAGAAAAAGKTSTPLPGVSITATNSLTGRKYTTTTDINGAYAMAIPRNGRYVVRAQLAAFADVTSEVLLNSAGENGGKPDQSADFGLQLASRAAAAEARQTASTSTLGAGLQSLNLATGDTEAADASANSNANSGASMPTLANLGDAASSGAAADSVAVSGQLGQTNGLANFSEDEIRQRVEDAVAQARASGMLPQGAGDPTNAIVGAIGGMLGGGGPGGPGGGGPMVFSRGGGGGGRGGFGGGFRNFNPSQIHGNFNYQGEFASLDSAPWSPTLTPVSNPAYTKNSFGASLLGSPHIPGLTKPNTKQFVFLNFSGRRDTTPEILNATVPTLAQRGLAQNPDGTYSRTDASFAGLTQNVNGKPAQVLLYDPANGSLFNGTGLTIPAARISAQARALLDPATGFYPLPNIASSANNTYNYQTVTTAGQNSANLNARYVRNFGASGGGPFGGFGGGGRRAAGNATTPAALRQNLNAAFNYSHAANDLRNSPFLALTGANVSDGYGLNLGYIIGRGRLTNNSTLNWNRSHATTRNYFTNTALDPAAQLGIAEPAQQALPNPAFYNGLPGISITNFTGLSNTVALDTIGQTISFSDFVSWRHKKHNLRFGFDFRRVHQDSLGGNNPLGIFTFTGYATESPADQAATAAGTTSQSATGTGFADLLLGLPQQTKIQAGLSKIYLRENVYDWFAQDDFRVLPNVTLNLGLRYEYFAPFTEKNGRLVNLTGVTEQTSTVGCVTPTGLTYTAANGTVVTCGTGPTSSLIRPDHAMYSPRAAVAWRPKQLKNTVFRAGYGINYNTQQFATFARALSYQQPFARTENNTVQTATNATGCTTQTSSTAANITFANGFGCSRKTIQNTYSVNPNYRLGYVHVYNLDLQHSFAHGIVVNLGYNGSHGSNLDILRAPNHLTTTITTPDAVAFTYEDSLGFSRFNALTLSAQKRLQKGISLGATYVYAHSIDNASSFGGASSTSPVQNDARLDLEESNSSFDVRHKLSGNFVTELPFGPNRAFLNKGGWLASTLDGFALSGNFTFASGSYFTPSYSSSAAEIAAGGTYTLRPNRDFSQPIAGAGKLRSWFNPAAFTAPSGYGTASRNSIEGPGQVLINASLGRTVRLGDTRSFEGRLSASNVFNTVQYSGINTVLNSATFGQVTSAAAMRKITFTARYRF